MVVPTMRIYALPSEYLSFVGTPLTDSQAITAADTDPLQLADLRRASSVIDEMLLNARYATNSDGYPTDERVIGVIRDATCAQFAYFGETGDLTGGAGLYQSGSLGSSSFTRGYSTGSGGTGQKARWAMEALQILRVGGLISYVGIGS